MKTRDIILAFGFGAVACYMLDTQMLASFNPMMWLTTIAQKVGVTFYPLIILSMWSLYSAYSQETFSPTTQGYIATTAQRIGLLGTVIGLVTATMAIGTNLSSGAAGAVSGALPAVGEALLSTAMGFVIALQCDFIIYLKLEKGHELHI
ncbi:MotA/TolQ/ExbB proton channel family protein [Lentisphaera profundi]|uniref:MotA/TolQ/ExbB proton channel family protein n=1 Tax=Lentisphaera profundi TaxID=1658616 RepID=A0ABY7VSD9_9BACT|nr:MotA/TolQ/ExbB proton channel family protein [Lentisphaera profundi]WDE96637.1 MotA/TolQ/ExbB proton channel family protein [Lentisphaera profundi]